MTQHLGEKKMAQRIGRHKVSSKEALISLADGVGDIIGDVNVTGAATFSSTLETTGLITATAGLKGASVARPGTDGLAGTGTAPTINILTVGDEIITTIKVDLTGLKKKSDVGDVIGKVSVANASLIIYAKATHGVLHKVEISCPELPTGTNVLKDFDIISADETDLTFDGDAAGGTNAVSITAMGGNIALGQTYQDLTAGTPNADGDALYLCEGAASTNAQLFTAGMLVIKLYGSKEF